MQELLQQLWQGLPVRFALRDAGMNVAVEKAALGRLVASEVGMDSEVKNLQQVTAPTKKVGKYCKLPEIRSVTWVILYSYHISSLEFYTEYKSFEFRRWLYDLLL